MSIFSDSTIILSGCVLKNKAWFASKCKFKHFRQKSVMLQIRKEPIYERTAEIKLNKMWAQRALLVIETFNYQLVY